MDLSILKKKISSYRTSGGKLTRVPDELALEILYSWEQWSGSASGFYQAIGVDFRKVASLIGRAKKLKREGMSFPEFKEIQIEPESGQLKEFGQCSGIEVVWKDGQIIRFLQVETLLDFLKKAA